VAAGAVAARYLAGLTLTAPDRGDRAWWRPKTRPAAPRIAATGLVAAALGALAGRAAGWSALLPAYLALALFGAALAVIDVEHHRLPNRLVYPLAGTAAVLLTAAALSRGEWSHLARAGEAAAAALAVLFALNLASPRSFGAGDAKLGGILAAYLGWSGWGDVYYGLLAGFVLGAAVALVLLTTRRATRKTAIAFGPMLLVGALLVLAFGLVPDTVG
jgi:leader peptidase (prepilin peptidase) / N-methyltransferase